MSKINIPSIAGKIVSKKGFVSAIDLFVAIGWLTPDKLREWKAGKVPYLERVITANLHKLSSAMKEFRSWAIHSKLKPSLTVYKHKSCKLHFSKSGNHNIETAYSTHYVLQKTPKSESIDAEILA